MVKIPKCMSTQHPDNVTTPFFSDNEIMAGETEVKEAFFVFSQLDCKEQMWDSEGKDVDNQVVEKLLSKHQDFFTRNQLGKDFFLTYRVPNPSVQKAQGKILLETLHGIPRAFDVAKAAGLDSAPIFEVILPMTTSHVEVERVKNYYEKIMIKQKEARLGDEKLTVKDWVGDFLPERINVIPLFEDKESILNSGEIVDRYIEGKKLEYQRVFIARSDPALNYGSVSAVLLAKISLQRLHEVDRKTGVEIYPIIGVGSAPFRGNFAPQKVDNCGEEYPSVQTYTVQSAFKYDYPFRDVVNAIDMINHLERRRPLEIDEGKAIEFISKISKEYEQQLGTIADLINGISAFVPGRRARKLHVGLFGYSRSVKGMKLPRAIKFCASFYSLGIPAELLGLSTLNEKEFDRLHEFYIHMDADLRDAAKYANKRNVGKLPARVRDGILKVLEWIDYEEDEEHHEITNRIYDNFTSGKHTHLLEDIKAAAWNRRFLG